MADPTDVSPQEEHEEEIDGSPEPDDEVISDEEAHLPPDHPLYARVQAKLREKLERTNKRLVLELREKTEGLKKIKRRREELGVELYSVQQALASLQGNAEQAHGNFDALAQLRKTAEDELEVHRGSHTTQAGNVKTLRDTLKKVQMQLDAVNATLGQVDTYNEELKAQIAVTRRATYKADENITGLEKEKKRQDLAIDRLDAQLRQLEDQVGLYDAQYTAQKKETETASETLAEAAKEMEAIQFEKKNLLTQWKGSLVGMQRRDEALQKMEDAIRKQQEQMMSLDGEINGVKKGIRDAMDVHERLTAILSKVEMEAKYLEGQVRDEQAKMDKMKETYSVLQATLEKTDAELAVVNGEAQSLLNAVKGLQSEGDAILNEQRDYEEAFEKHVTQQLTLRKGAKSTEKATKKITSGVHEKEMALAQNENELSRIKVDVLNTTEHNARLQSNLDLLLADLKEQEAIIDKYELEIRRRNDAIEKKQAEVDRLNKKYDQLKSNLQDENTGPLEATIHNLRKLIAAKEQECRDLQNYWLRAQRELVNDEKKAAVQSETLLNLRSRLAVLQQKKLRLDNAAESHTAAISEYNGIVRNHHLDLTRLATLVSKNTTTQGQLAEGNLTLESDFMGRLRTAESDAIQTEQNIEEVQQEKVFLLGDVIEAERQIMLWEKKIQLARETQDALDPNVGAAEVRTMEKEIHRMRLRYSALTKKQEKMIAEMEKSLMRREHIETKGRTVAKRNVTQASMKKNINDLHKKLKQASADSVASDAEQRELLASQDTVGRQLDESKRQGDQMRQQELQLGRNLEDIKHQRQINLETVTRLQRLTKRMEDHGKGKGKSPSTEGDLSRQLARRENIAEIVQGLRNAHPHYDTQLSRVLSSLQWTAP